MMERLCLAFAEECLGEGEATEKLLAMGVPAIELDNEPCRLGDLPIGASRIGGEPDLPPEASWPVHDGKPMAFAAQIDLAEVASHSDVLPGAGWLLFSEVLARRLQEFPATPEASMHPRTVAWSLLTTALASAVLTLYATRPPPSETLGDSVVLVGEIRSLARLETAVVPLQTTVRGTRGTGVMRHLAGEGLVFQGVGRARAGVDLAGLGPEDVWVDGSGAVWVRLPEAEVFEVVLDVHQSQVLARDQGWFATPDEGFETQARQEAQRQLAALAETVGLKEEAERQARVVITDLLHTLGADEVRFAEPVRIL